MKSVKILAPCACKAKSAVKAFQEVANRKKLDIEISPSVDMMEMVSLGVVSASAVVMDGKVVWSGSVPTALEIEKLLNNLIES